MSLGVVVNEHHIAGLSISIAAVANHAILRCHSGAQEGVPAKERNTQPKRQEAPQRGSKAPKPDWREFTVEVLVPPRSQQIVFVAVAFIAEHWEFCLENLMAEQWPQPAVSPVVSSAFAPVQVDAGALASLSVSERIASYAEVEDDDESALLEAIAASVNQSKIIDESIEPRCRSEDADPAVLSVMQATFAELTDKVCAQSMDCDASPGFPEIELELALQMSLAECPSAHTGATLQEADKSSSFECDLTTGVGEGRMGRWNHAARRVATEGKSSPSVQAKIYGL